jgi:hypothetical protein
MIARGVLIKPWIFREVERGYWDVTAEERVAIYRRFVQFGREHWGRRPMADAPAEPDIAPDRADAPAPVLDEYGRTRLRDFLRWHVGFWCRYAPRRPDGTWPTMQQREGAFETRSPLEALLARHDDAALEYVTDELLNDGDFSRPPAPGARQAESEMIEAG